YLRAVDAKLRLRTHRRDASPLRAEAGAHLTAAVLEWLSPPSGSSHVLLRQLVRFPIPFTAAELRQLAPQLSALCLNYEPADARGAINRIVERAGFWTARP